jgi:hypothetical protein
MLGLRSKHNVQKSEKSKDARIAFADCSHSCQGLSHNEFLDCMKKCMGNK